MEKEVLLKKQNSVAAKLVQVDISKWKDAAASKPHPVQKVAYCGAQGAAGQLWGEELNRTNLFLWLFAPPRRATPQSARKKAFVLSVCSWCWADHFSFFDLLNTPLESLKKAVIKMQSLKCGHQTRN